MLLLKDMFRAKIAINKKIILITSIAVAVLLSTVSENRWSVTLALRTTLGEVACNVVSSM